MVMVEEKSIIEKLQNGEQVVCLDCGKSFYVSVSENISESLEFYCPKCNSVFRVTPNVIIE